MDKRTNIFGVSMPRIAAIVALALLVAAHSTSVLAQGVQTGTVRGVVKDTQGLAVPGATVTATSPALQGPRTVVTDTDGAFTLSALPAGEYTLTFELSNFATVTRRMAVPV